MLKHHKNMFSTFAIAETYSETTGFLSKEILSKKSSTNKDVNPFHARVLYHNASQRFFGNGKH